MSHDAVFGRLLDRHGRTFADEAGIRLRDEPAPLFQLLVLTHLLSANLAAELGLRAAEAMRRVYRTADAMAEADDDARHAVLVEARYLRKRRTAELLGRMAHRVVEEYRGDLRRLREAAAEHPDGLAAGVAERIADLPGIGSVGADIFCREVQTVWPDLQPRADERVADTARALGLPHTARGLADAAGTPDLARLGAALIRCTQADDVEEIRSGR